MSFSSSILAQSSSSVSLASSSSSSFAAQETKATSSQKQLVLYRSLNVFLETWQSSPFTEFEIRIGQYTQSFTSGIHSSCFESFLKTIVKLSSEWIPQPVLLLHDVMNEDNIRTRRIEACTSPHFRITGIPVYIDSKVGPHLIERCIKKRQKKLDLTGETWKYWIRLSLKTEEPIHTSTTSEEGKSTFQSCRERYSFVHKTQLCRIDASYTPSSHICELELELLQPSQWSCQTIIGEVGKWIQLIHDASSSSIQ